MEKKSINERLDRLERIVKRLLEDSIGEDSPLQDKKFHANPPDFVNGRKTNNGSQEYREADKEIREREHIVKSLKGGY